VPVRVLLYSLLNTQRVTVAFVGVAAFLFLLASFRTSASGSEANLVAENEAQASAQSQLLDTLNAIPGHLATALRAAGLSVEEADLEDNLEEQYTPEIQKHGGYTSKQSLRQRFKQIGGLTGQKSHDSEAQQKSQTQSRAKPKGDTSPNPVSELAVRAKDSYKQSVNATLESTVQGSSPSLKPGAVASFLGAASKAARESVKEIRGEQGPSGASQKDVGSESTVTQVVPAISDSGMYLGAPQNAVFPWITPSGNSQALEMDELGKLASNSNVGSLKGALPPPFVCDQCHLFVTTLPWRNRSDRITLKD
jgi:hypothetical protein